MLRSAAVARRRRRGTSSSRAFTLVELLVVIGIIALLISILMPTLSKARAQAQRVVCASNMRQLALAVNIYVKDSNGWLPFVCAGNIPANQPGWLYTKSKLSTPRRQAKDAESSVLYKTLRTVNVFRCPNDVDGTDDPFPSSVYPLTSFTMNLCMSKPQTYWPQKASKYKSHCVMFWEPDETERNITYTWDDGTSIADQSGITQRHGKTSNIACVDGHVETWTQEQFRSQSGRNAKGPVVNPPNALWCMPNKPDGGKATWNQP
jgi:prepilin-type N-terminal cleavage/methylation domain-containing protein/prepilin-type processing-associated H-X9-DG protein